MSLARGVISWRCYFIIIKSESEGFGFPPTPRRAKKRAGKSSSALFARLGLCQSTILPQMPVGETEKCWCFHLGFSSQWDVNLRRSYLRIQYESVCVPPKAKVQVR